MWSHQNLQLMLCTALSCVSSAAGLVLVFGYEGRDVTVSCPYDPGYERYQKYLCNSSCGYSDFLIRSSQENTTKYSVYDDKTTRVVTVTISDLHFDDTGKYWCGVTRAGKDIYTEVQLEVKADRCCDTVNNIQGNEDGSVTISCPYDSQSVNKLKFFCRGNRPSTCLQQAVITSSNTQDGRFRLSDDRKSGIFTVTISSLTLKDSGSYLCGVQRNSGFDVFTAVELEVKEKGEQNASREKELEDLPPSITTEVYQHQSRTVKTIISTTPPASEEQAKAPLSSAAGSIRVFGYEGGDVNVSCPYDRGFEGHQKYLCNHDCRYADVLITTSQGSSGKYSIHDDKTTRIFTVTISDLRLDDAGKYWCGVTRIGRDISIERELEVKPDRCCDTVNQTQSTEEGSVTISCPYDSQSVNKLKFFCRGNRPSTCLQQAVITSSNTQDGRFRLSDDRKSGIFTVTISSLTLKDSGSYLCGVQRNSGFDVFTAVQLEVKEWCCAKSKNMSGVMERSVTFQCPYAPQHHNDTMFLCKGDGASNCTDMMGQSRFVLSNVSSSSFSVTVTKLEAGDAGTYWCGSGPEANVGNFTRFHLSVDATLHQLPHPAFYALFALAAGLLLMVTLVLVKVYKNKCHKTLRERKVSR
ncbi:polymeric immunoglobulin receptor-like isoform X1 [Poecilia latipinna]|uniref:polymeric immunoglobulin receptor-like isoform X1 n=1 Tax=Poecilia latipinna TaxID=48699 RepID=UPI00072DAEF6|nr:PREDICTED: polymeric immunoglobulin receptor-like isoform X1 [Poecilia latipinna]